MQWKYTGWVIALLVPLGIAAVVQDRFIWADVSFVISALLAIGSWLCSKLLQKKRQALSSRKIRRDAEREERQWRDYRLLEWLPVLAIAAGCGLALYETSVAKKEAIETDVNLHLQLTVGKASTVSQSSMTISNNSSHDLTERHLLTCQLVTSVVDGHRALSMQGITVAESPGGGFVLMTAPVEERYVVQTAPIRAGGDAISEACTAGLNFGYKPPDRFDLKVYFYYYPKEYPADFQMKSFRVAAEKLTSEDYEWHKQPIEGTSRCERLIKK